MTVRTTLVDFRGLLPQFWRIEAICRAALWLGRQGEVMVSLTAGYVFAWRVAP